MTLTIAVDRSLLLDLVDDRVHQTLIFVLAALVQIVLPQTASTGGIVTRSIGGIAIGRNILLTGHRLIQIRHILLHVRCNRIPSQNESQIAKLIMEATPNLRMMRI